MIQEYALVRTLVEKEGYKAGTMGVVVSLYSTGPACEVELQGEDKYPVDVVTYRFEELEVVE